MWRLLKRTATHETDRDEVRCCAFMIHHELACPPSGVLLTRQVTPTMSQMRQLLTRSPINPLAERRPTRNQGRMAPHMSERNRLWSPRSKDAMGGDKQGHGVDPELALKACAGLAQPLLLRGIGELLALFGAGVVRSSNGLQVMHRFVDQHRHFRRRLASPSGGQQYGVV